MNTAPIADPLEVFWPADRRERDRQAYGQKGRAAGLAQVADVPATLLPDGYVESYAAHVEANWLKDFDEGVTRAAAIVRAPEAVGREGLAGHLARHTSFSAPVAIEIMRRVGDVGVLPVGAVRAARLDAMRRSALLEG